jgi:hypothetical protein
MKAILLQPIVVSSLDSNDKYWLRIMFLTLNKSAFIPQNMRMISV